jgi:hypothetical protein
LRFLLVMTIASGRCVRFPYDSLFGRLACESSTMIVARIVFWITLAEISRRFSEKSQRALAAGVSPA